jgi:multiple sugar transport system permease protein
MGKWEVAAMPLPPDLIESKQREMISMPKRTASIHEAIAGYLFLTPNFIGFIVFTIFPVIGSLLLSFSDWNLINPPTPAGLQNYCGLFQDHVYLQSLLNTAYFSFASVLLNISLALFLAILLNHKIRGLQFFRTAYFTPVVFSSVAVALIWQWMMDADIGILNYGLHWFGLGPYPWLISPQMAMFSVVLVSVWKGVGYNMVIFIAALKSVPAELYEVARIDGANAWGVFWNVTWPMISPATFFVSVTSIINSFQVFDVTTVLTNGGPANATNTLVMLIYQHAFQFFRMGYASAIAYTLFAIVLLFTVLQMVVAKRWVHY